MPVPTRSVRPTDVCEGVTRLPGRVARGVSYVHNYQDAGARGYGSEAGLRSLAELSELGVTSVSVMPFGFMSSVRDERVRLVGKMRAGETDARVEKTVARARERGMRVLLKPHVWIRGGAYRGKIDPGDDGAWARWFDSYERFLMHYAELGERTGAEVLSIGVELGSATRRDPDRFRAMIAKVRKRYRGRLVYSANWDEARDVTFWDALDYVGVQFFAPLADHPGAAESALLARAREHMAALEELALRVKRPVLFTEVGYKSVEGTAVSPHLWPERLKGDEQVSNAAQLEAYRAFLRSLQGREWVAGLYVWKWFSDVETREEGPDGFSPRGKPALDVLRCAFGGT